MPNAPTHDFITLVTAAGANAAYYQMAPFPDFTLAVAFTGTYLFAGYACAGDLDLDSKEYRRWGRLRFLWWPYRKLVPHRSWISHGLLLGGIIRILYLATACTLLFWGGLWLYGLFAAPVNASAATRAEWQSLFAFARVHRQPTIAALTGFILAGTTHALADIISTWFKRKLRE